MLKLEDVRASYGPIPALHGVTLEVSEGSVVAVLGANGGGKSSTLRAILGLLPLSGGRIVYDGQRIDGDAPDRLVQAGISLVPEGRHIFSDMTVIENLRLGAYVRRDGAGVARDVERMLDLFPPLRERRIVQAGLLSGGEQQMLAIARALMSRPRLLLLDEPSLGLAPLMVREIYRAVESINRDGVTVLLVEQNANIALDIARHVYVLETGRVVLEGPAPALRQDESVRRTYLGY